MLTKPPRRAAVRLCLVIGFVATAFASFAFANPSWAKTVGIDVWNVNEVEQELADATHDSDRLSAEDNSIVNRIHAKEVLVDELILGRLSLADATAQFRMLNADSPHFPEYLRASYPSGTDEERAARNVIDYATQRVADPAEREALACRLTAELAELARNGR